MPVYEFLKVVKNTAPYYNGNVKCLILTFSSFGSFVAVVSLSFVSAYFFILSHLFMT